jgi:hypothetical protein
MACAIAHDEQDVGLVVLGRRRGEQRNREPANDNEMNFGKFISQIQDDM